MSIKPIKNFSGYVDVQTDTPTPNALRRIQSSPSVRNTNFMKSISTKLLKDNKLNKRIFNQSNKEPSWCSVKRKNSNDKLQSKQQSSSLYSLSNNLSIENVQSNQMSLKSFSSSEHTTSDNLFYNPFINKLRNPSVILKHNSFTNISDSNFEPFFPEKTSYTDTTDYSSNYRSESPLENNLEISRTIVEQNKYCIYEHTFHWTKNIEQNCPWVRYRSKEIFDYVNEHFMTQTLEVLKNDSEQISNNSKSEVAYNDCNEPDDNITYEVANKLCDMLLKHNKTDSVSDEHQSDKQCLLNENLKWTKLYKKLIDYEQL